MLSLVSALVHTAHNEYNGGGSHQAAVLEYHVCFSVYLYCLVIYIFLVDTSEPVVTFLVDTFLVDTSLN